MNILYENKDLIIVFKDKGVPVQQDNSGEKALVDEVSEHIKSEAYVITRLDRPVRGLTLFAKNKNAAAILSRMTQQREIHKIYYAVVSGQLKEPNKLENYIFKNQRQNISKIVNKGNVGAKLAVLEFEPVKIIDEHTLVKIKLITGRHHQIRVQLAHYGYPLYGDTKYNPQFRFKRNTDTALFAAGLEFIYNNDAISVNIMPCGGIFDMFLQKPDEI